MKVKTSVTLSRELLDAIDSEMRTPNRSAVLEQAGWEFLRSRRMAARDASELKLLNEGSADLNKEALDTLDYQDST